MNKGIEVLNQEYNDDTMTPSCGHLENKNIKYSFSEINMCEFDSMCCFYFRYGGISVGGRLPVLNVDPKTIQNAAAQIGRLLNVTGVNVLNSFHCLHIY